jgi:hypothetical protein
VFNATAERAVHTTWTSPSSVIGFLGHLSLLYVMPAIGTAVLMRAFGKAGGDDDDLEQFLADAGKEALGSVLNGMVLVRELSELVKIAAGFETGSRGYEGPAGLRPIALAYRAAQQVRQGEVDEALLRSLNAVGGVALHYPSTQVQRMVDGYLAWQAGEAGPQAMLTGPPKKASR